MIIKDPLTWKYQELLDDTYDCVDRIVLNACFGLGSSGGGFRLWWNRLYGTEENLDNTHLMRFAGHFARRIRACCEKNTISLIYCKRKERKEVISSSLLPETQDKQGVFCIIVGKAPAPLREVVRCSNGQPHIRQKNFPMPITMPFTSWMPSGIG